MCARRGIDNIAELGSLLGVPARMHILNALADGRARPAGALAVEAGIAQSTASRHLAKLVEGGLLRAEYRGRFRLYRIEDGTVREALDSLRKLRPADATATRTRPARESQPARTCSDHIGGPLGTVLLDALLRRNIVERRVNPTGVTDERAGPGSQYRYVVTGGGRSALRSMGIMLTRTRRPETRYCVNAIDRRHHIGGLLGAELFTRFLSLGWLRREPHNRALDITAAGAAGFGEEFGIAFPAR